MTPVVDPAQMSGGGMATPEQKSQLMDMLGMLEQKMGEVHAARFAGDNKKKQGKADALRQVFTALQSAGVDISNPASVTAFLDKLRAQNPEMAQLFEEVMQSLLGGQEEVNQNDMANDLSANEPSYETVPEALRGRVPGESV